MRFKRLMTGALALVATGLLVTACSSKQKANSTGQVASKQVLDWSYLAELATLDPSKVSDAYSGDIINNSMEGLYRLGKNSKIEPGLATQTEVSDDNLTYTFKLRKDDKWSNGDKVTAHDFVYGWRRTVDQKTASPYAYLYSGVKNADAIIKGEAKPETLGITAKDEYTLVVTLEKPIPYFQLLLGFEPFLPQNQKAVEKFGDEYGTSAKTMVYNGPFVVEGWTGSNLNWKLNKNPNYWDKKKVKLETINFKVNKSTTTSYNLYQSKQLDYTTLSNEQAKQLAKDPAYSALKQARTTYLEFNQTKESFKNLKIRQALSYAVDRQELAKNIVGGGSQPSLGIVSQGLAQYKGQDFAQAAKTTVGVSYDKKKAKELLKEGLAELGQDKLSFTLMSSDDDVSKKVAEFIQSQLEENLSDVKVSVQSVPLKTRIARGEKGEFDVQLSGWSADFADPISFLDLFTKDNSYNFGKWENAEYDRLIEASKTTDASDKAKRFADLVQASKVLSEHQGVAPLYQTNVPQLTNVTVKGLIQNSAGATNNWKEVYIVE